MSSLPSSHVQDTICTQGIPTTAGSAILEGFKPSYDATCVANLKAAGASILGKANCDQFAMGSTTETSSYHVSDLLTSGECTLPLVPTLPGLLTSTPSVSTSSHHVERSSHLFQQQTPPPPPLPFRYSFYTIHSPPHSGHVYSLQTTPKNSTYPWRGVCVPFHNLCKADALCLLFSSDPTAWRAECKVWT